MEPTPKPLGQAYIIRTKVTKVDELFEQIHVSGVGKEAVFKKQSRGWFLLLEGSHEALHVGFEKPTFNPGDKVEIVIRKDR